MIAKTNVKINIGLNVLRKRGDGFHDIETLFWPCDDYSDTMELVGAEDYSRTSSGLFEIYGGKLGENDVPMLAQGVTEDGKMMITVARREGVTWDLSGDLCVKAYRLLQADFPDLPSVKLFVEKGAPVGAGLGGGSADAARMLVMLNEMCGLDLSLDALASYAGRLGSDCAFFIYNRPMFGQGRGDVLSGFDTGLLDGYRIRIVVPEDIAVSTAEAYRGVSPRVPEIPLRELLTRPVESWRGSVLNDFEASVFASHPALRELKSRLYAEGAVYASMSGSGSAVFGIFKA